MARDLWAEIDDLVARGKEPIVKIDPGAEIRMPKKLGRPKFVDKARQFAHYPLHVPGGRTRMRCRAARCYIRLGVKTTRIVCSDKCEAYLREECEAILAALNGTMDIRDYPTHLRVDRTNRKKVAYETRGYDPRRHAKFKNQPVRGVQASSGMAQ